MLRIQGISKTFQGRTALHPLSLEVRPGEIFGLLGHNGAGKSTTFGILLGQIRPDAGEAWIGDVSVQRQRERALRQVGAIFEAPAFYDYLSGLRNLRMLAAYSGGVSEARLRDVIELVGLTARIGDRVRVYSHGMRQRLALAQALLPEPKIILLDEPSEGLDPEGIEELRRLILRLQQQHGLTVVISSHLLSEVEQMCDRIAILNEGRLMYCGTWNEGAGSERRVRFDVDNLAAARTLLERVGASLESDGLATLPDSADIAELVTAMVRAGIAVSRVEPVRLSLEDFYLRTIRG
jgi:ABC-2 type transport system ATP-binding protein